MKRLTYSILAVLAVALLGFLNPTAQSTGTRIGFVNSQQAIDSHPAGQAARDIEQRGLTELQEIEANLNALVARAQTGAQITPEEQELYTQYQASLESVSRRYAGEVAAAAEPAVIAVDAALSAVAAEQGFSMIFDFEVARASGLIVYAEDGLDITELVIQRVQGQ